MERKIPAKDLKAKQKHIFVKNVYSRNTVGFPSVAPIHATILLVRGTIINRTYGTYTNLYISLFLLNIFGPIYYGPPY